MTYRNQFNKDYTWAELIGAGVGLLAVVGVALLLGAALMLIPAWIGHWILVNLFNYTALSLWQKAHIHQRDGIVWNMQSDAGFYRIISDLSIKSPEVAL